MIGFVIWNLDQRKYVQDSRKAKDESAFTKFLERAKVFSTREAALKDKCGNETIRSIAEIMGGGA